MKDIYILRRLNSIADRLKQIINDYKKGKINEDNVEQYLAFLQKVEDREYYRTANKLKKIKDESFKESAEEEYWEELRHKSVNWIIKQLLIQKIISQDEFKILYKWCVEFKTLQEIAEEYDSYKMKIYRIIQNIQDKCYKYLENGISIVGDKNDLLKCVFLKTLNLPKQSYKEADTPRIKVAYLFEFYQYINAGQRKDKNGNYHNKTMCILKEYFEKSFGDNKTACTICTLESGIDKCKVKECQN